MVAIVVVGDSVFFGTIVVVGDSVVVGVISVVLGRDPALHSVVLQHFVTAQD